MDQDQIEHYTRLIEAILFASADPVDEASLARHLPAGIELADIMGHLSALYAGRGVELGKVGRSWAFRTAADLAPLMQVEKAETRKLSRAAVEVLAIIAYHQPITRHEIEEIRGVSVSRGTFDTLLEAKWIRPRGRRKSPGRPMTWGTTPGFLDHFGLETLDALPGLDELKAAGLLDTRPAAVAYAAQSDVDEGDGFAGDLDPDDDEDDIDQAALDLDDMFEEGEGEDVDPRDGAAD